MSFIRNEETFRIPDLRMCTMGNGYPLCTMMQLQQDPLRGRFLIASQSISKGQVLMEVQHIVSFHQRCRLGISFSHWQKLSACI
jgi:hypothetical protein